LTRFARAWRASAAEGDSSGWGAWWLEHEAGDVRSHDDAHGAICERLRGFVRRTPGASAVLAEMDAPGSDCYFSDAAALSRAKKTRGSNGTRQQQSASRRRIR
jgi:hypothetical protein